MLGIYGFNPKRRKWIVAKCKSLLPNQPLPNVLDVGSADGWIFRGTGIPVISVDLDTYALPYFIRADAECLPFRDKAFKVAVLGEILEHVRNPVRALREGKRVAEIMLITVPMEHEWEKRHKPLCTLEERLKETGLTPEAQYLRDNPKILRFCKKDIMHGFHRRWYTDELLKKDLRAAFLDAKITPLRYDGWSFRVIEASNTAGGKTDS